MMDASPTKAKVATGVWEEGGTADRNQQQSRRGMRGEIHRLVTAMRQCSKYIIGTGSVFAVKSDVVS